MVDILMATYNGINYIEEQINSILMQTYQDWNLIIRDDGSNDGTIDIIKKFKYKYSEKIIFIEDGKQGLGAKGNFAELLKYSKNNYCMFCDQDDIWIENKIEDTLKKMKELEFKYGNSTPILVHTDLKVVNENLNVINSSFWNYQNLNYRYKKINNLLVQNNVTGCTVLINKTLLGFSKNIPESCIMHDWWLAIIASCLGVIGTLNESTILYRQHGNNEVGAHRYKSIGFILNRVKNIKKIKESIESTIVQAELFNELFKDVIKDEDKKILEAFISLKKKGFFYKRKMVIKYKFYKSGLARCIGYFIFV